MKKNVIKTLFMLIVLLFVTTIGRISKKTYAWDDCPKGMVNDKYPGNCPLYIDTDENGICDHSEPAPENRVENQKTTNTLDQKRSDNKAIPANKETSKTDFNNTIILSILIPLIIIIGYVSINKIKQENKS